MSRGMEGIDSAEMGVAYIEFTPQQCICLSLVAWFYGYELVLTSDLPRELGFLLLAASCWSLKKLTSADPVSCLDGR